MVLFFYKANNKKNLYDLRSLKPELLSKAEPRRPVEKTHFSCSYSQYRPFGHYPQSNTIGEVWNEDRLVNRELYLTAQHCLHHMTTDITSLCLHSKSLTLTLFIFQCSTFTKLYKYSM